MAKARIRYKKELDGNLRSVNSVTSGSTDAKYNIFINVIDCTYTIRNINSGRSYTGGDKVNNLHVLKRHVKSRLEKLGVSFDKEIRDNSSRVSGINCSYKRKEDAPKIRQEQKIDIEQH